MREFANQKALQAYVELHDLVYLWEGGGAFAKRFAQLPPKQCELVDVKTKRGVRRALLFSKAILRAEFEANRPFREALAIKRERLQAKGAAKKAADASRGERRALAMKREGLLAKRAAKRAADAAAADRTPFNPAFLTRVDELELSVRTSNCLKSHNIVYIGDLVQKSEAEMLRTPNFGRKCLNEIKEVLAQVGLHLGMEVPDWPPDNIDELARKTHRQPS
jgi:hypothetical protein